MTNYTDLPFQTLVQHEIDRYVFNQEKPKELEQHLIQIIVDLIKQHGFKDYDRECIVILQRCLMDFYKDLIIRFKQYLESIGSSITFQDALEKTLDDVMSNNLRELYLYMKSNVN